VKNDLISKNKKPLYLSHCQLQLLFQEKINVRLKYDLHDEILKVTPSTIKLIMSSFFLFKTVKLLS